MSLRNVIIVLLTLAYFIFCYKYFNKDFFPACCGQDQTTIRDEAKSGAVATTPAVVNQVEIANPITFAYNSADPKTTEEFDAIKEELLAASKENDMLEITGYYFDGEEKPEKYDDMGIYRAIKIIELISPPLDQDKITTLSKKVDELEDAQKRNFESHAFNWLSKEEAAEPKITTSSDGNIRILFAENSTKFEESEALDRYLDELAKQLKSDKNLKAYVVGHTDKTGSATANQTLSESRARKIRRILRKKGVSRSQLEAVGRGEYQSIAPNDTEAGKRLNRRVEIRLDTSDK